MFFHLVTSLMMNCTPNFCRYPTLMARQKNLPLFLYQAKNLPNDSIHTKGHHYQFDAKSYSKFLSLSHTRGKTKKNLPLFLYQAKNLPNDSIHTKGHHYQFVCGKKYNIVVIIKTNNEVKCYHLLYLPFVWCWSDNVHCFTKAWLMDKTNNFTVKCLFVIRLLLENWVKWK